jgi:predicted NodU family carbamoyl transferase
MLEEAGLELRHLDKIAVVKFPTRKDVGLYAQALRRHYRAKEPRAGWPQLLLDRLIWQMGNVSYCYQASYRLNAEIDRWVNQNGVDTSCVRRVDHHTAHAFSAYYCSGFENALVVTMDGQGAGVSATISEGKAGTLKRIHTVYLPNSVGQFYTLITLAAGFTMNRHERKDYRTCRGWIVSDGGTGIRR